MTRKPHCYVLLLTKFNKSFSLTNGELIAVKIDLCLIFFLFLWIELHLRRIKKDNSRLHPFHTTSHRRRGNEIAPMRCSETSQI